MKRATALPPAPRARAPFFTSFLGLAPQALFCHLLRRFRAQHALRYLRRRRNMLCGTCVAGENMLCDTCVTGACFCVASQAENDSRTAYFNVASQAWSQNSRTISSQTFPAASVDPCSTRRSRSLIVFSEKPGIILLFCPVNTSLAQPLKPSCNQPFTGTGNPRLSRVRISAGSRRAQKRRRMLFVWYVRSPVRLILT